MCRKIVEEKVGHATHSQNSYGVDAFPVKFSVAHDCCIFDDWEMKNLL